jgi:hypothetical protein
MKTKKIGLLTISLIGSILLIVIKYAEYTVLFKNVLSWQYIEIFFNTLIFFPVILFFSLLTYTMPQTVFASWWKFARWSIPTGFALVILINLRLHHTPGGWLNMDAQIDLLLAGVIYGIFVIGSIVSIVRGYKKTTGRTLG